MPHEDLIDKLMERLDDADPVTRRNAAGALRLHGKPAAKALPALRRLLTDSDPLVRQEAERALARLRPTAA